MLLVTFSFGAWAQLNINGTQSVSTPVLFSLLNPSEKIAAKSGIHVFPSFELTMDEDLTINSGAVIQVDKGDTLSGAAGAILNVKKIITTSSSSTTWLGIKVDGIPSTSHFTTDPNPTNYNDQSAFYGVLNAMHGRVSLFQGAFIERALHGVESNEGGIVESMDITTTSLSTNLGPKFHNCKEGIYIGNYTASNYSANRLNGVSFLWDDYSSFNSSDYQYVFGVFIEDANGTYLGGCKFINSDANSFNAEYRGMGVYCHNPNVSNSIAISEAADVFYLDSATGCTIAKVKYVSTPGTFGGQFKKLSAGVFGTIINQADISNHEFENNFNDIHIVGTTYFTIRDNTFLTQEGALFNQFSNYTSSTVNFMSQIYADQPERLFIYRNTFDKDIVSTLYATYPTIQIENAKGKSILIQKNDFDGEIAPTPSAMLAPWAIFAAGNLANFEWICNHFTNYDKDVIYYGNGPGIVPRISGTVAGNTYSNLASTNITNNTSNNLTYRTNLTPNPSTSGSVTITPSGITRTWENGDCDITCAALEDLINNETASVFDAKYGSIKSYPNPANNNLNIELENLNANSIDIALFNSLGQMVMNQTTEMSSISLDVGKLPNGLYFIKYNKEDKFYQSKVVIQH